MVIPDGFRNLADRKICADEHIFRMGDPFILDKFCDRISIKFLERVAEFGLSHAGNLCQVFCPYVKGKMIFYITLHGI